MKIDLYPSARERVSAIARELTAEQLATMVPAAPKWSVRDLLAHAAGVAEDLSMWPTDNLPPIPPSDEYTASQVERRRDLTVDELLAGWEKAEPRFVERMGGWGRWNAPVHDLLCHEADLRGALDLPRLPDEAWQASLDDWPSFLVECAPILSRRWAMLDDAVLARVGDREYVLGVGTPSATVEVPDGYDLWRALFGGRSRQQIASWAWSTDPAPYLATVPFFYAPDEDLQG
ncbi:maleylpyruvate isomerase family mycothiol-dependent enzyme [Solwaraspora sp. WMMB335]|uniref:maleylpyruvate isomerase family mycothiol-dependent enzyme n=1 Tax=Solwaraspora sp. WMMB335 TaxID=3404118 RepID=UPI003B926AB8